MEKKKILTVTAIIIILLLLSGTYIFRDRVVDIFSSDTNQVVRNESQDETEDSQKETDLEENVPVKCLSDSKAKLYVLEDFNYRSYFVEVKDSMYNSPEVEVMSLSIEDLKSEEPTYDLIFDFKRKDYEKFPHYKIAFELCDNENFSTRSIEQVTWSERDKEIAGLLHYFNGDQGVLPSKPGNYRLDIYINIDGEWKLINRVNEVKFVE